jgi:hypothetical protein
LCHGLGEFTLFFALDGVAWGQTAEVSGSRTVGQKRSPARLAEGNSGAEALTSPVMPPPRLGLADRAGRPARSVAPWRLPRLAAPGTAPRPWRGSAVSYVVRGGREGRARADVAAPAGPAV